MKPPMTNRGPAAETASWGGGVEVEVGIEGWEVAFAVLCCWLSGGVIKRDEVRSAKAGAPRTTQWLCCHAAGSGAPLSRKVLQTPRRR